MTGSLPEPKERARAVACKGAVEPGEPAAWIGDAKKELTRQPAFKLLPRQRSQRTGARTTPTAGSTSAQGTG